MLNIELGTHSYSPRARDVLSRELERRCRQNPKYSLRAFARALGIHPATLCMVLSGKRRLSKKTAKSISLKLGLNPVEAMAFVTAAVADEKRVETPVLAQSYREIALDQFATISDWHHYGILSLIETRDFKPSFPWIASRLGISVMEAKAAVERLERLEILDTSKPRWRQLGEDILIENEISTAATRKFQTQALILAQYSLENDPPKERDISSLTMAIDPADLAVAAEEIRKFKIHLMKLLEKKGTAREVYHLAIQFYPVSRNGKV